MSGDGPKAWADREGFLWLAASEPGEEPQVFCYDDGARRRMGEKWPVQPLAEAEESCGPLTPLEPRPARRRARCLYCGTMKPVTGKGLIRKHYVTANATTLAPGQRVVCGGSGRQA